MIRETLVPSGTEKHLLIGEVGLPMSVGDQSDGLGTGEIDEAQGRDLDPPLSHLLLHLLHDAVAESGSQVQALS